VSGPHPFCCVELKEIDGVEFIFENAMCIESCYHNASDGKAVIIVEPLRGGNGIDVASIQEHHVGIMCFACNDRFLLPANASHCSKPKQKVTKIVNQKTIFSEIEDRTTAACGGSLPEKTAVKQMLLEGNAETGLHQVEELNRGMLVLLPKIEFLQRSFGCIIQAVVGKLESAKTIVGGAPTQHLCLMFIESFEEKKHQRYKMTPNDDTTCRSECFGGSRKQRWMPNSIPSSLFSLHASRVDACISVSLP